jgi:hypothetical protein
MMDAFIAPEEQDVPYWYGERALTGLLAAAAWQQPGGWSLEEFLGHRTIHPETRSAGRGDLWIGLGSDSYTIEAKVAWVTENADAESESTALLSDAAVQLRALATEYRVGEPLSVCYVVPSLSAGSSLRIADVMDRLQKYLQVGNHLVARYVPTSLSTPPVHDKRSYPGIVLVGRLVSWES